VAVLNRVATINVFGEIGMGGHWRDVLKEIPADVEDIRLLINSPGGDCITSLNLVEALRGRVSTAEITEKCYSAALVLALCAEKIYMRRSGKILCHAPQTFVYSHAYGLATTANALNDCTDQIRSLLIQRTELTALVVESFLNGADIYFTSEQALAFGLIDGIIEDPPRLEPVATMAIKMPGQEKPVLVTPTEDEALVFSIISALGSIQVRNRTAFARELMAWVATKTTETL
jgi:ATP-dependent protease ClpP protease subunit